MAFGKLLDLFFASFASFVSCGFLLPSETQANTFKSEFKSEFGNVSWKLWRVWKWILGWLGDNFGMI